MAIGEQTATELCRLVFDVSGVEFHKYEGFKLRFVSYRIFNRKLPVHTCCTRAWGCVHCICLLLTFWTAACALMQSCVGIGQVLTMLVDYGANVKSRFNCEVDFLKLGSFS